MTSQNIEKQSKQFSLGTLFSDPRVKVALADPLARSAAVKALQKQGFSADSGLGGAVGVSALCHALTAAEDELEMKDRQTELVTAARGVLRAARRQAERGLR